MMTDLVGNIASEIVAGRIEFLSMRLCNHYPALRQLCVERASEGGPAFWTKGGAEDMATQGAAWRATWGGDIKAGLDRFRRDQEKCKHILDNLIPLNRKACDQMQLAYLDYAEVVMPWHHLRDRRRGIA